MFETLFETRAQARLDAAEVGRLHQRHGEDLIGILEQRVSDASLSDRDRKHWARILRKARRG